MTDGRTHPRFSEDLVGLDPDDPEAQALAEHLDSIERAGPSFTIEGSLRGVADLADSSSQLRGSRRPWVMVVVALMLLGLFVATWQSSGVFSSWFAG